MRNYQRTGVRQYNKSELPRLRWTPELHHHFVQAVESLGGKYKATPKRILQMMNVKGLKLSHIKSHLQMYRSLKNHNGNNVITALKNLQKQRTHSKNHGVLSICSPERQLKIGYKLIDWENESNYMRHEVFSKESNWLVQENVATSEEEEEHQDSQTNIEGKMAREEGDCGSVMMQSQKSTSLHYNYVNYNIPDYHHKLNLDLTI